VGIHSRCRWIRWTRRHCARALAHARKTKRRYNNVSADSTLISIKSSPFLFAQARHGLGNEMTSARDAQGGVSGMRAEGLRRLCLFESLTGMICP